MKKIENKDKAAFAAYSETVGGVTHFQSQQKGLTKREYFAAKAMAALIANPNIKRPSNARGEFEQFSMVALEYADALLNALNE